MGEFPYVDIVKLGKSHRFQRTFVNMHSAALVLVRGESQMPLPLQK